MAVRDCPECNGKLSTEAESCPHCGYKPKPSFWKRLKEKRRNKPVTVVVNVDGARRRGCAVLLCFMALPLLALSIASAALNQEAKIPDAVKKAEAKLAEKPDDPDANSTVGKYLALDKGDFENGLPLLTKGSDKTLSALAQKDLGGAKNTLEKVVLGDDWSKLLGKFPKQRDRILDRLSRWYGEAWGDGLDEPLKTKLRERLARLYAAPVPGQLRKPPIAGWAGPGTDKIDSTRVHSGSYALRFTISKKPGLAEVGGGDTIELLRSGKEMEFSFYVLSDATDVLDDKLMFRVYDAQGKELIGKEFTLRRDDPVWTRMSEKMAFPEGAFKARVQLFLASTKGEILYDDFSLKIDGKEALKNGGFEEK